MNRTPTNRTILDQSARECREIWVTELPEWLSGTGHNLRHDIQKEDLFSDTMAGNRNIGMDIIKNSSRVHPDDGFSFLSVALWMNLLASPTVLMITYNPNSFYSADEYVD